MQHRPALVRFAASLLKNDGDAEDIIQDLYLKISKHGSGQIENPKAYLYQSVHRLVIDRLRSATRRKAREKEWAKPTFAPEGDAVDEEPVADKRLEAKQKLAKVAQAIEGLPPRCKEVFVRQRVQGQSQAEIADALGISRKAVEKQMTRALKHLTTALSGMD